MVNFVQLFAGFAIRENSLNFNYWATKRKMVPGIFIVFPLIASYNQMVNYLLIYFKMINVDLCFFLIAVTVSKLKEWIIGWTWKAMAK